nr:reverse transcriptase domain-containing protein [Tanacetum cinerariifolium]
MPCAFYSQQTAYQGPTIPTTSSSLVVERETEATKDTMHPTNNRSTEDVQPSIVPTESPILTSKPVVSPIIKPVASPVSTPKPDQRPSISYPSRLQDQKLRDKANDQQEKFFQIFKDLNFNISFADALILMPKFSPSIKSLLTNKNKLCKLARTLLNEHCSAVLLKNLPEKLGDPGKFLIPCNFPGMPECLAQADLGASINLMPLPVWNKLSLPDLSPTCMTLELADHSISRPVGVVEDVFVKVGTFHFLANFVVVDFDTDPRMPLILGGSFLKTGRALIDVFEGELTLRLGKEAITFNLDKTSRYSANYSDMTANRIDVIDMACEEYSREVLGFFDVIASGNPTPYYNLIVSTTSPTLTQFRNSDFLLEEVDAFLALEDDPTSPEVNQSYVDTEGDILLLEAFLNDDPSLPSTNQGNYLPEDLPPHLQYAFLEGDDKLPDIIGKDLSVEEKTALLIVQKSHKRAISWKLSDIKGIDLEICTHKILMEEDFEPAPAGRRPPPPAAGRRCRKSFRRDFSGELQIIPRIPIYSIQPPLFTRTAATSAGDVPHHRSQPQPRVATLSPRRLHHHSFSPPPTPPHPTISTANYYTTSPTATTSSLVTISSHINHQHHCDCSRQPHLPPLPTPLATTSTAIPPQPPLTPATTAGATATAVAFPAAVAAVVGCGWHISHHRRASNRGCPPPNHHRGSGRTTVQPPQLHLVVSGCDGATPGEVSGCSAA